LIQVDTDVLVRAQACITQLTGIITSTKSPSSPVTSNGIVADASSIAKGIISELSVVIGETDDPGRMEELLNINDQITTLLHELPAPSRPVLTLHGLGLNFNNVPSVGVTKANGIPNGHAHETPLEGQESHEEPDLTPTTPRIDKGKGRAEPEPEEPEKVLSPTLLQTESEDEDEDSNRFIPIEGLEDVASPTDR
jgi:protein phosphatase 1 regulatory subunit 37